MINKNSVEFVILNPKFDFEERAIWGGVARWFDSYQLQNETLKLFQTNDFIKPGLSAIVIKSK